MPPRNDPRKGPLGDRGKKQAYLAYLARRLGAGGWRNEETEEIMPDDYRFERMPDGKGKRLPNAPKKKKKKIYPRQPFPGKVITSHNVPNPHWPGRRPGTDY